MYGYEPIDGMIDDELIGQLEEVLAEKKPTEPAANENVETTEKSETTEEDNG